MVNMISNMVVHLSSPVSLSLWWNLGSLLGLLMVVQIVTGWLLTLMYLNSNLQSFDSIWVLHLDSWNGSLLHWVHVNGASFIFLFLYMHMLKGLFIQSWKFNKLVWGTGFVLMVLIMATAFLGYVLPYGQMSLWGATVITNLISVISSKLVVWIWAGYSVNSYTLQLFFTMHYVLPMVVLMVMVIHLMSLHMKGSTHMSVKEHFWPYYVYKDLMNLIIMVVLFWWTMKLTYYTSDPDNFIKANPSVSPLHIKPEWYFLQYYAILRSITNKPMGILLFVLSLLMLVMMVLVNDKEDESWSVLWVLVYSQFMLINLLLVIVGGKPVETPHFELGQWLTFMYFMWFMVLLSTPVLMNQKVVMKL